MLFFFQAEDGIRDLYVTGVQTCALPISGAGFAVSGGLGFSGPERRNTGGRSDSGSVGFACTTSLFAAAAASCSADFHVPSPIQLDPARAAPVTVNRPRETPLFTAS